MSAAHRGHHSSRTAPYPTLHHHHTHVHSRDREGSSFEDGPKDPNGRRRSSRGPPLPDEASFLPSNDRNEWYYPAAQRPPEPLDDDAEDDRDEEALQASRSGHGNWGNKLVKGSRWMRKGKIVAWGPTKADWDMDEKARKRLRRVLPRSRSPTPEAPNLPHLRPPTPPLIASYNDQPSIHRDFTSFVLDPSVQDAFTSTHIASLQDTATELIAGEASMRKAFGGLWRILQGDLQRPEGESDEEGEHEHDDEETVVDPADVRAALKRARRGSALPQDIPPLAHLFVSPNPVALGGANDRYISPQSQLETFEWCLGVMRELADHGKEYLGRLEEIRNGLGEARAVRGAVWTACRKTALDELAEGRPH